MSGRAVDPSLQVSTRGDPIERSRSYRSPTSSAPLQCELIRPADRPCHGTKGELISLLINWFRIKYDRIRIYIYKLAAYEVAQQQSGRGRRGPPKAPVKVTHPESVTKIFWQVVRSYRDVFIDPYRLVFDDHEYVFTPDRLRMKEDKGLCLTCNHPDKVGKRVEVRFNCHELFDLDLKGDVDSNPSVQWTSIFLKSLLSQNTRYTPPAEGANAREIEVSKRFAHFDGGMFLIPRTVKAPKKEIVAGVEAWIGLFASVRRMENFDPVINLGLMNKLFVQLDLDLITFYLAINSDKSGVQLSPPEYDMCMSHEETVKFTRKLKDIKLKCSCVPGTDKDGLVTGPVERHYRFIELVDTRANAQFLNVEDPNARETVFKEFIRKDGSRGRMFKRWRRVRMDEWYYAQGVQLKYPSLPLALVKTGKREDRIPMEVLSTHDKPQKYIKLLDFWTRMKIPQLLLRSPDQHYRFTKKLVKDKLEYDNDPFMKAMDISLDPKMIECEGRVVEPCAVLGKSDSDESMTKLDTKKETGEFFVTRAVETSNKIIRFVVYKLTDAVSDEKISEFYQELVKKCITRGFTIPESDHEEPFIRQPEEATESHIKIERGDYLKLAGMIETDRTKFERSARAEDECLVFLFFTKKFDNLYGEIKYLCDIQYGVVSQVVDEETARTTSTNYADEIRSDYKSVYHHICLKLNAKLGGINQIVAEPDEPEYGRMPSNERTMFIGIDVIHPSPNSPIRDLSLAAIVASMDKNAAKYAVRIKVNSRCNESVQQFDGHFAILLARYHSVNGFLPERVVILRDGVSDSEMVKAASMELNSIKVAWRKCANGKKEPPFTYIVCQKRHKTRFYRTSTVGNGEVSNPPMGTVVDKDVVMPHMFDFYMVSHYTPQGTTRPIHYTVVYDECKSSADVIQEMLFRMCFLYARCSKPVSLPSPVYYAHLACERAAFQHEYALRAGEVEEILDKGVTETVDEYAHRVELQAIDIEKKLQVSKKHPGMYFI